MAPDQETLTDLITSLADSLAQQLEMHVELAKAEVRRDVKELTREARLFAIALPLFLAGYLLVCVSASMTLAIWLGPAAGFAIMGALNLGGGGFAVRRAMQGRKDKNLSLTVGPELKESAFRLKGALQDNS